VRLRTKTLLYVGDTGYVDSGIYVSVYRSLRILDTFFGVRPALRKTKPDTIRPTRGRRNIRLHRRRHQARTLKLWKMKVVVNWDLSVVCYIVFANLHGTTAVAIEDKAGTVLQRVVRNVCG
jgi:hypothetical protein